AAMTAELVNELSDEIRRVLEEHPVNQQRREQARHGMAAAMVAPTKIIAGSKASTICDALTTGSAQFGFVHVKAVDDCGHDRRLQMKVMFQEVVDVMIGQMPTWPMW
ncbi:metalloenzyme domain-containing protein, partial [Haematococcus lacustris]